MASSSGALLGQWVAALALAYFEEQRQSGSDKLFTKISGIDKSAWTEVLQAFEESKQRMAACYEPVVRTLASVEGFEQYQCQEHETSTWLRNNNASGHALIILMNARSAEAQSLENIFTIDEARLLSAEGLEVLYSLLADSHRYYGEEMQAIKTFMAMYTQLSAPQLRNVLSFFAAIIEDSRLSVIDKIQGNLDQLMLFRDGKLEIRFGDGFNRLKKNYQLARMENKGKSVNKEGLADNLYTFIERTADGHELWQTIQPEQFREQALAFIHHHKLELLQYEYEVVEAALLFKTGKKKLGERLGDFKEQLEAGRQWTGEQESLLLETLEAIDEHSPNPDKIQQFLDDFSEQLKIDPKLRKDLERKIHNQRRIKEYMELSDALLSECVLLLGEQSDEETTADSSFQLSVADAAISEANAQILRFHLMQVERLIPCISFDADSLHKPHEKAKKDVELQLVLYRNGEQRDQTRFKLLHPAAGRLSELIDDFENGEFIPYIQQYKDSKRTVHAMDYIQEKIGGYRALGNSGIGEAADAFADFVAWYKENLLGALEEGIGSIELGQLERRLEKLLEQARHSHLSAHHVYQYISCLGALDSYDGRQADRVSSIQERTLTLLNPLRLLAYAKRLTMLGAELVKWTAGEQPELNDAGELSAYFQQQHEQTLHLFPRYFAMDGSADSFLIECQERWGEGLFSLNGRQSGQDRLIETFADEFLATVKTYLEVYPYAQDCLDLTFLYCPHEDYAKRAIDQIFRHTGVRKVRMLIHSEAKAAVMYESLNGWICQDERYAERHNSFPRVEIQVLAEKSINAMMKLVSQSLIDADIGVLINYFGESSSVRHKLERVSVQPSDNWFDTVYREPSKRDEAAKRISLVSEKLPELMQSFYRVQYMVHQGETPSPDEHYLLRNVITVNRLNDAELINYMHEHCNWTLLLDRYLDKALLRHLSSAAQIIKYKSNAGKDKGFKTLVSSSKYIRKLMHEQSVHEYYDRLYRKMVQLLKNEQMDRQFMVKAIERVKDISGGIVLRSIGPGKFIHELMAIYLATEARTAEAEEMTIWSVCDELPWFQEKAGRRPDMVRTSIRRENESILLHFELVELKFIKHTIFDTERHDAIKQVQAGMELYQSRFLFESHPANAELWRKELVHYLLDHNTYEVHEALLLKELQDIPIGQIKVSFSGSVDTFVYTSDMLDRTVMEDHTQGYQTELMQHGFVNRIYNRSYILRALGAMPESSIPLFEDLPQAMAFLSEKLESHKSEAESADDAEVNLLIADKERETAEEAPQLEKETHNEAASAAYADSGDTRLEQKDEGYAHPASRQGAVAEAGEPFWVAIGPEPGLDESSGQEAEQAQREAVLQEASIGRLEAAAAQEKTAFALFPEQEALLEVSPPPEESEDNVAALVESYQKKLRYSFNQNGIQVKIVDSFVGISVIRIVLEIPGDRSYSSIEGRAKDIYLWLQLTSIPLIQLRNGRINIDINRDTPETVYFERFMAQAREQYPPESLKGRLIAPVGMGQLRELIAIDFSSSNTPHLLIGGTTGSGKSVTMNAIILALMCMYTPDEVQFIFVDPKKVEFMSYDKRSHTKQVITEIEEAVVALEQLVEEMEQRYRLFAPEGVQSIDQYVELTGQCMPRLIVVFDEFADFMEQEKSLSGRVESAILRLGAKARAAGIHLLICTQNPKADIVPTNIRNNLPARLALKTADHHASKIIISEEGAETLGGKGDFMMKIDVPEVVRGKSPFLTPRVKRALLRYFGGGGQQ